MKSLPRKKHPDTAKAATNMVISSAPLLPLLLLLQLLLVLQLLTLMHLVLLKLLLLLLLLLKLLLLLQQLLVLLLLVHSGVEAGWLGRLLYFRLGDGGHRGDAGDRGGGGLGVALIEKERRCRVGVYLRESVGGEGLVHLDLIHVDLLNLHPIGMSPGVVLCRSGGGSAFRGRGALGGERRAFVGGCLDIRVAEVDEVVERIWRKGRRGVWPGGVGHVVVQGSSGWGGGVRRLRLGVVAAVR